jgi:hypothetical protein
MTRHVDTDNRQGPRYLATLEVKAEWDANGQHVIAEGITENVGPEGTLVHLPRQLPMLVVVCVSKCSAKVGSGSK